MEQLATALGDQFFHKIALKIKREESNAITMRIQMPSFYENLADFRVNN